VLTELVQGRGVIMSTERRSRFIDQGRQALRAAAELEGEGRSVLTVYLDLSDWDEATTFPGKQARRIASALSESEREALEVSLELVQERLGTYRAEGGSARGIALFVSLEDGKLVSLELPQAPRPELVVDEEAMVWQLALLLDEYEPVGVIVVDGSEARVLVMAGRIVDEHRSMSPDVRHLAKVGGWSQMRYQRRRRGDIRRAAGELAEKAVAAFEREGVQRVVLAGREEMMVAVVDRLPKRWRDRVVDRVDWDLRGDPAVLAEKAQNASQAAERRQERQALDRLRAELRRGGLAASGVESTANALNWGAVDVLLVGPTCTPDAREELVSAAVTTSAAVEVVPGEGTILDGLDGVAALLRFPVDY
jgi:peptide chain release factor subunit 1